MGLKQLLLKILPKPIISKLLGLRKKQEINALYALKKADCDTGNLLSTHQVGLDSIFISEAVHKSWAISEKEIEIFNIPDFTGGVNPGDRRAIYYLVRHFKPNSVLEVGTHIGASTINIASALAANNLEDHNNPSLKTVDIRDVNSEINHPWLQHGTTSSPREMMKSLNFNGFVEFISNTSFNYFKSNDQTFDFIFLDGDHSAKTVYNEIPVALKKLNPGGVILLHDYFPKGQPLWSNKTMIQGPYIACERHVNEGAKFVVVPLGNLPWPTKLNSNTTSLALVLKK